MPSDGVRAVIDTNVLLSGLLWRGTPHALIQQIRTGAAAGNDMEWGRRLLIIDDWGPEPLTAEQRRDLLEIVEDRYNAGSLIITSQLPVDRWYELVGNPTLADAILDRIVHNA